MKKQRQLFIIVISLSTFILSGQAFAQTDQGGNRVTSTPRKLNSVAVVEFFSAAGCTKCGEVDKELMRIKSTSEAKHTPVIILTCHVDYVKEPGIHDRLANSSCSEQQSRYSSYLKRSRLGVPHLIVNGEVSAPSFIPVVLDSLVARGLNKVLTHKVSISAKVEQGSTTKVNYKVSGYKSRRNGRFDLLRVILVNTVPSTVSGEADRSEINPVQAIETLRIEENTEGSVDFPISDSSIANSLRVIGIVNDGRTNAVLAAAFADIATQ